MVQSIKNAIQKVQSPQIQWVFRQPTKADRQKAKDNIHQKANEQKQIFEKLPGVDAKSVAQAATIDRIVQRAKQKLDEAVVNAGLIAIKQSALEAIGTVNQPNLLRSFQTIDVNEVNRAESVIQVVGDGLKKQFNAIENVDPVNLQQQINRIDQVITIAKKRLNGAKTNTAVDQIQGETLADLVSIAAPSALTLEREIREQAHRQIDWAGAKKQAEIDLLPRPVKLTYQTLVTQLRAILAQVTKQSSRQRLSRI
ncbi:hypothetical protein [Fructobacillus americanaquae]|uniref:Uncharacterized protein n=1 Tax=Fructobacillus americanaquae TaxID=2940302 RepID=A0ABY5C0K6_9LACO|nr:hypothetical protein [Fructobacillus americanaquae]USS92287.1 hypothetical protein M3M36_01335 [Fructobacillus americanaquae]